MKYSRQREVYDVLSVIWSRKKYYNFLFFELYSSTLLFPASRVSSLAEAVFVISPISRILNAKPHSVAIIIAKNIIILFVSIIILFVSIIILFGARASIRLLSKQIAGYRTKKPHCRSYLITIKSGRYYK